MYELTGATSEVVLYWENTDPQFANSKVTTVKGLYLNGVVSDYFYPFYVVTLTHQGTTCPIALSSIFILIILSVSYHQK